MKSNSLLVLAFLLTAPAFAQSLPDEINYPPHETRYRSLSQQVSETESSLGQSRMDLEAARKFVREMTAHIGALESEIRQLEGRIHSNQRRIPELQGQIAQLRNEQSRLMDDVRRLESQISSLEHRHRQEVQNLRPLEEIINRKLNRIREIESEVANLRSSERNTITHLNRLNGELNATERAIEEERTKQKKLAAELQSVEGRISVLQGNISQFESQITTQNGQLTTERQKLDSLKNRVQTYKSELDNLRSQNAPAEQIKETERKLSGATTARDNTAAEIRKLEGSISALETQVRVTRGKIEEVRRDQAAIPARIAQSEAQERKLVQERSVRSQESNRLTADLQSIQRNIVAREGALTVARQNIRSDEANLMRQQQVIENLVRQINDNRSQHQGIVVHHRQLDQQVSHLEQNRRTVENEIPQLQTRMRDAQSEIAQGKKDIANAEKDERDLLRSISDLESKLAQLVGQRDEAQGQMNQRLSLYNRYLGEARDLGATQSDIAAQVGGQEGKKLAVSLALQNGQSIGLDLGLAEARHWGHVRGEVQGHEAGHAEGLASPQDRLRGEVEGRSSGLKDAHLFAQQNFKPVFFEEFLLEEFKRPLHQLGIPKILKKRAFDEFQAFQKESVEPLSAIEIERSDRLVTALDESIVNFAKDVKVLEAKARRLTDPQVAYQAPAVVPYGMVNCASVYKALAVFKKACETSYKDTFSHLFLSNSWDTFKGDYSLGYQRELMETQLGQREASYQAELSKAHAVGKAQGLRLGKEEIYQKTFKATYRVSYDEELPLAREKSKSDAASELKELLLVKPLLTLTASQVVGEEFRGGEEIHLVAKLKNISKVPFKGAATIRITHLENAEADIKETVLGHADALSITEMPKLKLKIKSLARAGEKIVIKGIVDLPGDIYRGQRQERFELSKVLSANPAHALDLAYAKNPDIKGIFRRNIHFLSVKIGPKVENIPQGYKITLSATGENAKLIELKETSLSTGALSNGQTKEMKFSYTFVDGAKNRPIDLNLSIHFDNKIIKTESIELVPR